MTTPYLVLARKYRPQRFQDLTGQEHVVRTLVNALKSGRVAHAFLFTGPRGCGKTTSARILARALNCEKGPTPEPCGVCGPCVDIAAGNDVAAREIGDGEAAQTLGALDTSGVRDIVSAVLARDASAALGGVVRPYEQGADMKRLAEELAWQARNLVLASLPGVKQDLPDHEVRSLAQQAAQHDSAQLARVFELLQLAQDEVAKAANPRHALEVALLRAVHLAPAGSLPELVAKLDALGRGAPASKPAPDRDGARVLPPETALLRAAPTPPPAAAPEPDLQGRWRSLLDSVRAARKAGAAAALEHAIPLKIDRGGVQIAFRKGAGQAAIVQEARPAVEAAFEKALGFRVPLQIVEQDAPADTSVAEQKQKLRAAASESRIALAREHPAVRAAVEVLGGEIEDVRDLGEE